MDRTLDAEMDAARAAARRRRSLRDLLLEAEDRSVTVTLTTIDGVAHRGVVEAVGSDHVDVRRATNVVAIALAHITSFEVIG